MKITVMYIERRIMSGVIVAVTAENVTLRGNISV